MSLLGKNKNFRNFFWTQFLGAFNDNVYKNSLMILLAYKAVTEEDSGFLVSLASGLFLLPFLLFSAYAGQLADKIQKSTLIRFVKIAEIAIMIVACFGFWFDSTPLLLVVLFAMGAHSAFFGPAKYSLLPELVQEKELMPANSVVETGTFLAILTGTILGGFLISAHENYVCAAVVGVAILGYVFSRGIRSTPAVSPGLKIEWNFLKQYWILSKVSRQDRSIFWAVMAISWFWLCGSVFLTQMPTFIKFIMHSEEEVVTFLLSMFTLSLAVGSYLANRLAHAKIELALVLLGGMLMGFSSLDLGLLDFEHLATKTSTLHEFLFGGAAYLHWRVMVDLFLIGTFGSLYIVPLYALLQFRSDKETISQVIAANNVFNGIFMVSASVMVLYLYKIHLRTEDIFALIGVVNTLFMLLICVVTPEYLFRFVAWSAEKFGLLDGRLMDKDPPGHGILIVVAQDFSFWTGVRLTHETQRPLRMGVHPGWFSVPFVGRLMHFWGWFPMPDSKLDLSGGRDTEEKFLSYIKEVLAKPYPGHHQLILVKAPSHVNPHRLSKVIAHTLDRDIIVQSLGRRFEEILVTQPEIS